MMKNKQHVCVWVFFLNICIILTFVPYQGDNRLNITLLIGLLHHTEPILQVLKALVVGDVVHQEDALHWKKKYGETMLTLMLAGPPFINSHSAGGTGCECTAQFLPDIHSC